MGNHVLFSVFVLLTCHVLVVQMQDYFSQFNQYIPQANQNPLAYVGLLAPNGGDPCANPFLPQYQYHLCSNSYKLMTNPWSYANARGLARRRRRRRYLSLP